MKQAPPIRITLNEAEFLHLCQRQAIGFHIDGVEIRIRLGDGVTEAEMVVAIGEAMKGPHIVTPEARDLSAYRMRRR